MGRGSLKRSASSRDQPETGGVSEVDTKALRSLLERWQAGEVDERFVHEEAERLWGHRDEWPLYRETDPRSIPLEVLEQLEILNHQLITREDVPTMLAFLDTPPGEQTRGWAAWRRHWQEVDIDARRTALAHNPYYLT